MVAWVYNDSVPLLAHVLALRPTPAHVTLFLKAAGCARLAFNWALAHWNSQYEAGEKPTWMTLQKAFVARIDADVPFLREIPSHAYAQPFRHLHQAFQRFSAWTGRRPASRRSAAINPRSNLGRCAALPGMSSCR